MHPHFADLLCQSKQARTRQIPASNALVVTKTSIREWPYAASTCLVKYRFMHPRIVLGVTRRYLLHHSDDIFSGTAQTFTANAFTGNANNFLMLNPKPSNLSRRISIAWTSLACSKNKLSPRPASDNHQHVPPRQRHQETHASHSNQSKEIVENCIFRFDSCGHRTVTKNILQIPEFWIFVNFENHKQNNGICYTFSIKS